MSEIGLLKYTRLHSYIESLPKGLDSYPECTQKAAMYRLLLEDFPKNEIPRDLPGELLDLVDHPRPVSTWIPEVHATALFLGIAEQRYPEDAQLVRFFLDLNRKVLSGPLYKVLMLVASPSMVLKGGASRWGAMHRGTTLTSDVTNHGGTVVLTYPPHHVPKLYARGYATAFVAAIEVAGGKDSTFDLKEWTPERARFEGTWR